MNRSKIPDRANGKEPTLPESRSILQHYQTEFANGLTRRIATGKAPCTAACANEEALTIRAEHALHGIQCEFDIQIGCEPMSSGVCAKSFYSIYRLARK